MNTGFNYGRMGLAGNAGLASLENARRWDEYSNNVEEQAYKSQAIGELLGGVTGAGLSVYQEYNKDKKAKPMEKPPGDVVEKTVKASVEDSTMPEILRGRPIVEYKPETMLDDEWNQRLGAITSKFPSFMFEQK